MRLREELRQEQGDPSHIPTARRDTTRFSVQDLTSLVPTQLVSSVNAPHLSVVPGSGPSSPQIASPQNNGICEVRSGTYLKLTTCRLMMVDAVLSDKTQIPRPPLLRPNVRHRSGQEV